MRASRSTRLAAVCAVRAVLVAVAVAPQLSARVAGEDYRLEVAPVDPIDPLRGAYVALDHPGLRLPGRGPGGQETDELSAEDRLQGTVSVPLLRDGDGHSDGDAWRGDTPVAARPSAGPYLRCHADHRLRCGIESLFTAQDEALRLERDLAGGAIARVRVDGRGNAAVVAVEGR